MSNEHTTITESLAKVATRANELCNTVDAQINNIKNTLKAEQDALQAKKTQFDAQAASSISQYQGKMDDFIESGDNRYQKTLSKSDFIVPVDLKHLDDTKFYPVALHHCKMLDLRIERYVHDDITSGGILDYFVQLQNWSNGGDFTFAKQFHHFYSHRAFVGKIAAASTPYTSSVWLRGGWSYKFYLNGQYSKGPVIIESETQVVERIASTDYFLAPITEVQPHVAANNFILGV
ncbi:hypothetical protein [Pseudoalteromonas luteoviolacea]|uniref:Uncharacterized protein n=1 Tax=Pseudoalteromonas luteoviolacea H33 TaxID=1365251 RepID=A0A167E9V3_9GAMM|nr:hypothetical protein [Pseudoalteromonas luteoviolacea]KZN50271.1 hypothetical protein N476_16680 [Pseudoalteromonas luteoviolacea H33]KZN76785.1 hypothetical protein N477_14360 [Pseudoalteromonas luteoviolacea H33-S]MBQ4878935.1 hypothetical protein [Pseudoalteromonas luteoviolacea]MBQ4907888.1 hypothetical protein [Pseudoalteromonas luteoviolacea]